MNGLTLRISSDKKHKPIKKDIQKEDFQFLLSAYRGQDITLFERLVGAETVENQVRGLKEISDLVFNERITVGDSLFIIEVFTYIFLHLKQKSPLLHSFLKFFSSAPEKFRNDIQSSLNSHLNRKLTETKFSFETVVHSSFTVVTCLENINLSAYSFSSCVDSILLFIEKSLNECMLYLAKEEAPIKKLVIINGIHGSVQAGISLFQKYPMGSQVNLSKMAISLLCSPDLPLDTRAASGILAAHTAVSVNENHWIETYEFILKSGNDLGLLSLCSGLLNVLTPSMLEFVVDIAGTKKCALYVLHDTVFQIEEKNASESSIVLAASRCFVLISRCYLKLPHLLTSELLDLFLLYIWGHIEHFMDAVRHLALTALSNIATVGASHPELGVFETILESICFMTVDRRSKHAAISALVSHVPVEKIMSHTPDLEKALFTAALANPSSNYALNSLEALLRQDLKERDDKAAWFEIWVKPLLLSKLSAPLEQILTVVIKSYPPVLDHITSLGLDCDKENIDVILTCFKIGRKFNLLCGKDDSQTWKGLVDLKLLESCMYHFEDEVRLSCLSLLIETSKSTEEFTPVELNLIETFFIYNSSTQDPAVRQKILSASKKLLTRIRDSRAALRRRQQKNARSELTCENLTCVLRKYDRFVSNLKKCCLSSLFPGSSPSRRSFGLGVLALLKQLEMYGDYDRKSAEILLSCLLDSYEDNKIIARDLLSSFPLDVLNFQDQAHIENYVKQTLMLSSSIRPPDSISAGYYMSLLASFEDILNEKSVPKSTSYFCLTSTLSVLKDELQSAKDSLLRAASSGPLYGHLFVIRHLIQTLDLKEIGENVKWCLLIKEIIEVAFECNSTVACVVYNSSPEGHIPMDFSYSESKKDDEPQVTSQMVLLCSWRTVKEVSLLLGELAERATIKEHNDDVGLLTVAQILAIGEHLTGLLSETKHRGAFEQAYIGFSKLTGRLWKCYTGELHELPKKWLDETLDCILTNNKLSATRRSAGIPFIVQGLICSELESGSCKSLHKAMAFLLKVSREGCSEGKLHALNILRALYRGSSLGEAVGPYVAEGIVTAINGFNSSTWAERNSATLLLSALMSRVFGVPRGKSEFLSWRNKMTGRLFFQRYPILYSEILSHLKASSDNHMYPALYPVLLLLGRLYPSSLEGTDSNLQLMEYVPFMMRCAESSVMKTRALAASALTSLITSASYESLINELVLNITETSHQNHLHGYLLMMLKLTQQSTVIEDVNYGQIKLNINKWAEKLFSILNSTKHSLIVKDTCVQIIIQFVSNYYDALFTDVINLVKRTLKDILFSEMAKNHYGCAVLLVHSAILLFIIEFKERDIDELHDIAVNLLQFDKYDVSGVTLEFLEFLSSNHCGTFCPDIHDFLKIEFNDLTTINEFNMSIKSSHAISEILTKKILSPQCHVEDLVKLLKTFQYFPLAFRKLSEATNVVEFFYNMAKNSHIIVVTYAVKSLNSFLCNEKKTYLNDDDNNYIVDLINSNSQPEADHQCRQAAAELLSNHFYMLLNSSSPQSELTLIVSAVKLILDESQDIRSMFCTKLIGNVIPSKGLELFLQKFVDGTANKTLVFIGLFYWAVGDPLIVDDFNEGTVFDKGNVNINYEDLILNRLACKHMKQLLEGEAETFLSSAIDDNLSKWLSAKTNFEGKSLLELLNNHRRSVDDCSDLNLLLPYRPSENQRILEKFKIDNILEAFNLCLNFI